MAKCAAFGTGEITCLRGNGAIAQLGERHTGSVEVSGSIPLGSTILKTGHIVSGFFMLLFF